MIVSSHGSGLKYKSAAVEIKTAEAKKRNILLPHFLNLSDDRCLTRIMTNQMPKTRRINNETITSAIKEKRGITYVSGTAHSPSIVSTIAVLYAKGWKMHSIQDIQG